MHGPIFLCRSSQSRNDLALSTTRLPSGFLDASSKGAALLGSTEQGSPHISSALQRRARSALSEKHKDPQRQTAYGPGALCSTVRTQGIAPFGRYFAKLFDAK